MARKKRQIETVRSDPANKQLAQQIITYIEQNGADYQSLSDLFDVCLIERQKFKEWFDKEFWLGITHKMKPWVMDCHMATGDDNFGTLFDRILLYEAPYRFSSYMIYLEKDRNPEDRFYEPRMRQLNKLGIIKALQDIEDGKLKLVSISMPPRDG